MGLILFTQFWDLKLIFSYQTCSSLKDSEISDKVNFLRSLFYKSRTENMFISSRPNEWIDKENLNGVEFEGFHCVSKVLKQNFFTKSTKSLFRKKQKKI